MFDVLKAFGLDEAMSRSQLKVGRVAEMIMRPFSFEQEQVEAH